MLSTGCIIVATHQWSFYTLHIHSYASDCETQRIQLDRNRWSIFYSWSQNPQQIWSDGNRKRESLTASKAQILHIQFLPTFFATLPRFTCLITAWKTQLLEILTNQFSKMIWYLWHTGSCHFRWQKSKISFSKLTNIAHSLNYIC